MKMFRNQQCIGHDNHARLFIYLLFFIVCSLCGLYMPDAEAVKQSGKDKDYKALVKRNLQVRKKLKEILSLTIRPL